MLYGGGRLRKFATIVEDIVEKFSFLALAQDQITESESRRDREKKFFIHYHTYAYVFMTKSFLDACAVFLNESYALEQRGSGIALDKQSFINCLDKVNPDLTKQLHSQREWFKLVVRYRNNLIHKHGLYVGPIPTVPDSLKDPIAVDQYILTQPAYIPNDPDLLIDNIYNGVEGDFIKVTCFVDEWINEAFHLFHIILSGFTTSFEVHDPNINSK